MIIINIIIIFFNECVSITLPRCYWWSDNDTVVTVIITAVMNKYEFTTKTDIF